MPDKKVEDDTSATVKMVNIDNDALVSDQACLISNSPESHGLDNCVLCWVCLVQIERVNNAFAKVHF